MSNNKNIVKVLIDGFYLSSGRGVGNYLDNVLLNLPLVNSIENIKFIIIHGSNCNIHFPTGSNFKYHRMPRIFFIWENIFIPFFSFYYKVDIVFFPSNYSSITPVYGDRYLTIHDLIFMQHKDKLKPSRILKQFIGRKYLSFNVKLMAKKADKIFAISNSTRSDLLEILNLPFKKILLNYNGPGLFFKKSKKSLFEKKIIMHFFSQDPRKNSNLCIDAFIDSNVCTSGFSLYLIGDGASEYLSKNNINFKYIKSFDFLNIDSLQLLVDDCRCLLYPSLYEGFGLPIVEFNRIGIPTITSDSTSCFEISSLGSIHVNPKNCNNISEAIKRICYCDYFELQSLSSEAIKNSKNYSWDKHVKKLLKSFNER